MSRSPTSLGLIVGAEFGRIDVGIVEKGKWLIRESRRENAVEGLATLLQETFKRAGFHPLEADEWIYSGGPGSLLSLRALAMILESWAAVGNGQPIPRRRYSGMVWTARHLLKDPANEAFSLISPWRTGAWNLLEGKAGTLPVEESLSLIEGDPSNGGRSFRLGSRAGSTPPEDSEPVDLPPFETILEELPDPTFLRTTPKAEPLQAGTTVYRRWEAKPHSAP